MEHLHAAFNWMSGHWYVVSTVATILCYLLAAATNKLTKNHTKHTGWLAVLTYAQEMISCFKSKGVPGWWKWPFTSVPPPASGAGEPE